MAEVVFICAIQPLQADLLSGPTCRFQPKSSKNRLREFLHCNFLTIPFKADSTHFKCHKETPCHHVINWDMGNDRILAEKSSGFLK